ncbi:MAG TPA: winged helix-turn-helix transcriptional regulator [Candidatus Copromonas faecavium]|uniref:Winged helix-turn-helix transcriptional regulator n=1 Tax=Candidatus Copromonas faecavium (nom. illeg.) TaxID=2840740 RepID=A0A9D1D495_9FIRM|nr:winged helix-turn-helix transcriptional regulator [Candidatus Copromonas faecavium]
MAGTKKRKEERLLSFADAFRALSDPTRREILRLLSKGDMYAGEIAGSFDMTGATISHHLSILKQAGLVDEEKQGKYIRYSLNTSVVDDIIRWMLELKG